MNTNVKQASLFEKVKQGNLFSSEKLEKMDLETQKKKKGKIILKRLEELGLDDKEYYSPLLYSL